MFRILSLDGGGIKGAFTASVLATLEEDTGKSVVDHFDLIAGTSTGGILAIGLGLGLSAREICDFYASKGPEIFPSTSLIQRTSGFFRQLFGPKHSHSVLRSALEEVLGKRKFGESSCRLLIPTYDAIGNHFLNGFTDNIFQRTAITSAAVLDLIHQAAHCIISILLTSRRCRFGWATLLNIL
jgi:uncharacterized protein